MTDPVAPSNDSQAPSQPQQAADDDADEQRTPEEIEALWQRRLSAKGREYRAAEDALRAENEALRRQLGASPTRTDNGASDDELERTRRELEQERNGRIVDQRRAKYPFVADIVEESVLLASSDVSLAKLNARLEEQDGAPVMAPTNPRRRTPTVAKKVADKSKEELLDDLKRIAPAYAAWQREQNS